MEQHGGVDLSGLHRELDALKRQLCRCGYQGECIACKGFEVLREQSQMVVAAASQPVLMQVAQEAAIKDLMSQMGGLQNKLVDDPRLAELMAQVMERVQEDLGGPEAMQRLFNQFGFAGGPGGPGAPGGGTAAGDHARGGTQGEWQPPSGFRAQASPEPPTPPTDAGRTDPRPGSEGGDRTDPPGEEGGPAHANG